jgi:hypothetical protein
VETLKALWEDFRNKFGQCYYNSSDRKDREHFAELATKLTESIRFTFHLAYMREWHFSSDEMLRLHVRRSDAYAPLFTAVRGVIHKDLDMLLDFLHVRSASNICITT